MTRRNLEKVILQADRNIKKKIKKNVALLELNAGSPDQNAEKQLNAS